MTSDLDTLRSVTLDSAVDLERLRRDKDRLRTRAAEDAYHLGLSQLEADALAYGATVLAAAEWPAESSAATPLVQGWTYPTDAAKKAHWFSNRELPGHRRQDALCGKYAMWVMDPAQVHDGRYKDGDCVACSRQLAKLVTLGHVVIGASTDERVGKDT